MRDNLVERIGNGQTCLSNDRDECVFCNFLYSFFPFFSPRCFAMDRNDSNRQSSLPSSLIPHLYTAPQQPRDSSTRTTLDPRPVSPIFPLYTPPDARPISPVLPLYSRHTAWRENEPGPSSLAQPIPRRLESYPLRIPERHDYMRETERDYRNMSDRDYRGRDYLERDYRDYWQQCMFSFYIPRYLPLTRPKIAGAPYNMQQPSTSSSSSYSFQALPPPQILLNPNPEDPSASSFSFDRHDPYTYPPIGSLSISAPTSTRFRSPESPDIYHPMYRYRSDSRSADVASNDGDGSQSGKRRRAESLEADDNTGKARNTRKTAVACNFCRGMSKRSPIFRKNGISSYLFHQAESYAAMGQSPRVITAPFANLNVNMSRFNAGEVQAKQREVLVRRRLVLCVRILLEIWLIIHPLPFPSTNLTPSLRN